MLPIPHPSHTEPDWQACQSFCRTHYPTTAYYFKYATKQTVRNDGVTVAANDCKCKTATSIRKTGNNMIAGEVNQENCGELGERELSFFNWLP